MRWSIWFLLACGCQDSTKESPPPPPPTAHVAPAAPASIAGIGIRPISDDKGFAIGQLFPTGAAAAAGLHQGDVVIAVDGESTAHWSLARVAERLRGPAGSSITLVIDRPGGPQTVKLERAVLVIPPEPQ